MQWVRPQVVVQIRFVEWTADSQGSARSVCRRALRQESARSAEGAGREPRVDHALTGGHGTYIRVRASLQGAYRQEPDSLSGSIDREIATKG
jgi:hypothetical protein